MCQFSSSIIKYFYLFLLLVVVRSIPILPTNNESLNPIRLGDAISKCGHLSEKDREIIVRRAANGDIEYNVYNKSEDKVSYEIPSGDTFEVKCLSRSPVTLKFHGLLANSILDSASSRFSDPETFCNEVSVVLASHKSATGGYECVDNSAEGPAPNNFDNAENVAVQSSVYIFASGNTSPHLLYAGNKLITLKVNSTQEEDQLVLPCLTTNASHPMYLFKGGQQVIPAVPYNPMKGFTISNFSCGGEYMCSEYSDVSVASRRGNHAKFRLNCGKSLENKSELGFKLIPSSEYRCLEATSMSTVACRNPLECEFLKSCGTPFGQLASSQICKFHPDECKNYTSHSCLTLPTSPNDSFRGLIFCSNDEEVIRKEIFSDVKGNKALNLDPTTGKSSPIRDYKKAIDFIPVEYQTWENVEKFSLYEESRFKCNASRTLAADGIVWLFELKNGSKIPASTSGEVTTRTGDSYEKTVDIHFNNTEIVKLICRVPKLWSNEWHEISHNISVNSFWPLEFLDGKNETKQVSKESREDDEHTLTCTAFGTNLSISWKKNGLDVDGTHTVRYHRRSNNVLESTIMVVYDVTSSNRPSATHDVYSCVAKSSILNQMMTKYFKVEWVSSYWIFLSVIGGILLLCFAIMAIGAKCLRKKWETKALAKLKKGFYEGIKDKLAKVDFNEGEKPGVRKRGDPNYYLSIPYNTAFEIKDPQKNLVIGNRVGGGQFGIVFEGWLTLASGEIIEVAVKELKDDPTPKEFEDFLKEIKLLQQLENGHENVVRFIGAVTHNMLRTKKPKIVFELCHLKDMASFLEDIPDYNFQDEVRPVNAIHYAGIGMLSSSSSGSPEREVSNSATQHKISTTQIFQWCYEIASGLEYLSSLGIVHRDIAARNILLAKNRVAKISDLGLSKTLEKADSHYQNSSNYYISPYGEKIPVRWVALEALGTGKFSEDTDIWAFGVLMWELFNRCKFLPYNHIPNNEYLVQNLIQELKSGRDLCKPSYANDKIYEVMLRCWSRNVHDRPRFSELKKLIREAEEAMHSNNSYNNNLPSTTSRSPSESESDCFYSSEEEEEEEVMPPDPPPPTYCQVLIIPTTEEHEI